MMALTDRERRGGKAREDAKPRSRPLRSAAPLRSATFAFFAFALVRHVRDQRDLPRALDRRLQLALVHRAGARDPARQDLAALGHERPDQLHVLVVDVVALVRAELADLAPAEHRPALALLVAGLLVRAAAAAAAATAPRASLSECHG